MNRIGTALFFLLIGLVQWPGLASAGEPPTGLLLRWQIFFPERDVASESLVYLDGLGVTKEVHQEKALYYRAQSRPGSLATLRGQLQENRVGLQVESTCKSDKLFPQAGPYALVITWFGRAGRERRLSFSNARDIPKCSTELDNIAVAVLRSLGDVEILERRETEP